MRKHKYKLLFFILLLTSTIFISISAVYFNFYSSAHNPKGESTNSIIERNKSPLANAWSSNGIPICTASGRQEDVQVCSDGNGGAIIVWVDRRSGSDLDIYAQRINSSGDIQWTFDGVPVCTEWYDQEFIEICSDGAGGVIVTWEDHRDEFYGEWDSDIYAQRIDSTGSVKWTPGGVPICVSVSNEEWWPTLCSDGAGGAFFSWSDDRSGRFDIYAQRVNSVGTVQWTPNGKSICAATDDQTYSQMCSDGAGGAIITWNDCRNEGFPIKDIYAQLVDSTGSVQWTPDGVAICTIADDQFNAAICSDGAGGAIIAWNDERNVNYYGDIYAQRIGSTGSVQWTPHGIPITTGGYTSHVQICNDSAGNAILTWEDINGGISAQRVDSAGSVKWTAGGVSVCNADGWQEYPEICSDGSGGAIITWNDYRNEGSPISDIYAQKIDSAGSVKWTPNGTAVCMEDNDQEYPKICSDGSGGAFIAWNDKRVGRDIYAQRVKSGFPTSDHPEDVITSTARSETINWTLDDDYGGGQYRVLANDTSGNIYEWVGWTSWSIGASLSVPINRTDLGVFNYTIEYFDDQNQFGIPDTLIVTVKPNSIPYSNHPGPITTYTSDSDTIDWILEDDFGGGKYRVLANDTNGNIYEWMGWTSWNPGVPLGVPIYRANPGIYNYTIEYYDDQDEYGTPDTVIITIIEDFIPYSNHPPSMTVTQYTYKTISWILCDDFGEGQYRVLRTISGYSYVWVSWRSWSNNTPLDVAIYKGAPGTYNYTIEYTDNKGQYGIPDTVFVTLTGSDGDDDDDDSGDDGGREAIPFGNYFLIFMFVGILTLVVVKKSQISNKFEK